MKAIHRIPVQFSTIELVVAPVPINGVALCLEAADGGAQLYLHVVADDMAPAVQRRLILFAAFDRGILASALLESNDLTGATYLGHTYGHHAWLLAVDS